jgi:hypothetical protein
VDLAALLVAGVQWMCVVCVVYLIIRLVRQGGVVPPSLRGWGSLQVHYGGAPMTQPTSATSARVGLAAFQGTISVVTGESGVTLQRVTPFLRPLGGALHIPYARWELVQPPRSRGPVLGLPVHGTFRVDGVDLWLSSPYAEVVVEKLGKKEATERSVTA